MINVPITARPEIDERGAGRRDDLRQGIRTDRADEPAGIGDPLDVRSGRGTATSRIGANTLGLPRASESRPSTPSAMITKPMNMRMRSSGERSRSSAMPHPSPINGNVTAAMPKHAVQQTRERIAHRAGGVEPHREHGEPGEHHEPDAERVPREWREDLDGGRPLRLPLGGRPLRRLAASTGSSCCTERVDGRDAERRDGEVFVAMGLIV